MDKRLALISSFSLMASKAKAAEGSFTWSHFLFGWLENPLIQIGIDPVPTIDLLIIAFFLVIFAFFAGKPFRRTEMLEPSGSSNLSNFTEVVVTLIFKFLSVSFII